MSSNVPFVTLNSGHKMPAIGLGTYKSTAEEVKIAVKHAINCGYRHIDCASLYKVISSNLFKMTNTLTGFNFRTKKRLVKH